MRITSRARTCAPPAGWRRPRTGFPGHVDGDAEVVPERGQSLPDGVGRGIERDGGGPRPSFSNRKVARARARYRLDREVSASTVRLPQSQGSVCTFSARGKSSKEPGEPQENTHADHQSTHQRRTYRGPFEDCLAGPQDLARRSVASASASTRRPRRSRTRRCARSAAFASRTAWRSPATSRAKATPAGALGRPDPRRPREGLAGRSLPRHPRLLDPWAPSGRRSTNK